MASIHSERRVAVSAERAWAAVRDVGGAARLFAGVLHACAVEGGDVRCVTFENGLTVRERIVSINEERRRVAYTVLDGRFDHHHASMQIVSDGPDASRFIWVIDLLPDSAAAGVAALVEADSAALKNNLEARGTSPVV